MPDKKPSSLFNVFSRKDNDVASLKQEISQLKRAVNELTILSDLAFALGGSAEPEEIVEKLINQVMRAVAAEQAVVTLVASDDDDAKKTSIRLRVTSAEQSTFHLSDSLLGWMYLHKKPLLMNDPSHDERFKGIDWDSSIQSLVCVPLLVKSELTGVLTIYNKKNGEGFTDDDQRLLAIIGAQSAQIIENARLHKESQVLAHMREQQEHARRIQRDLLPKGPPELKGYDIAGASRSAQTIGGDYFDFIPAANGRWAICLGDVSGKGLPASLLMANLQATLRAQAYLDVPVSERVQRSNLLMCENTDDEKFVTLFYGDLDDSEHRISFCSAGHDRPLLFSGDGPPTQLDTTGMALGVLDSCDYSEDSISMQPGDVLVIYSDGVTDATNEYEAMFGIDRLISVAEHHRDRSAEDIIKAVFEAVDEHAGKSPQFDDLTLVVVKRTE